MSDLPARYWRVGFIEIRNWRRTFRRCATARCCCSQRCSVIQRFSGDRKADLRVRRHSRNPGGVRRQQGDAGLGQRAALLWCYVIGQAVNGNLGDKFGGRRVMSAGAILSFVMNWATSLSTGIVSLSVFWGINGYFQSMVGRQAVVCCRTGGDGTSVARSTGSILPPDLRRCSCSPRRWWWSVISSSTGAGFSGSGSRCCCWAALRSIFVAREKPGGHGLCLAAR